MKKRYLLPLLAMLLLCACQENTVVPANPEGTAEASQTKEPASLPAEGFWTPVDGETVDWTWHGQELVIPYDETAFQNAPDRAELTDPESLRMREAIQVTAQTATVDGQKVVYGDRGGSQKQRMTGDGKVLISKGFTQLWVTTTQGSWQESDYCNLNHDLILSPDESRLAYSSGIEEQTAFDWQVYQCDLASCQTVQLTDDPYYSYEVLGYLDDETILCLRTARNDLGGRALVAVDAAGEKKLLSLAGNTTAACQGGSVLCLGGSEDVLYRWSDRDTLERVGSLPESGLPVYWASTPLSPTGDLAAWVFSVAGGELQLLLIDPATGHRTAAALPAWERTPEEAKIFWQDETTLLVQLSDEEDGVTHTAAWSYTLPA